MSRAPGLYPETLFSGQHPKKTVFRGQTPLLAAAAGRLAVASAAPGGGRAADELQRLAGQGLRVPDLHVVADDDPLAQRTPLTAVERRSAASAKTSTSQRAAGSFSTSSSRTSIAKILPPTRRPGLAPKPVPSSTPGSRSRRSLIVAKEAWRRSRRQYPTHVSDRAFFDYGLTFVPPISLGGGDVALMVVDMQYSDAAAGMGFQAALDVIDPGSAAYFDERVENLVVPQHRAARRRVPAARSADRLPVPRRRAARPVRLAATHGGVDSRRRGALRHPRHLLAWQPAVRGAREFTPQDGDIVVHKTTFGAFNSSNLDDVLREHGLQTIVMVGISTNCCVETTARDAADRGYAVVIVDEACADYDEAAHDASLRAFHFNFGRVVRTPDDVLAAVDAAAEV